jgi:hypothetical protein
LARALCAGIQYWAALPATVETVLGGYQRVSPSDVKESDAFLRSVFPAIEDAARRPLLAADCGAGVGRVTQNLLLRHFDEVDVYEPVKHFLDTAEANIGRAPGGGADGDAPRTVNFVCEPLEEFTPTRGRYDVIWAQARVACANAWALAALCACCERAGGGLKRGARAVCCCCALPACALTRLCPAVYLASGCCCLLSSLPQWCLGHLTDGAARRTHRRVAFGSLPHRLHLARRPLPNARRRLRTLLHALQSRPQARRPHRGTFLLPPAFTTTHTHAACTWPPLTLHAHATHAHARPAARR